MLHKLISRRRCSLQIAWNPSKQQKVARLKSSFLIRNGRGGGDLLLLHRGETVDPNNYKMCESTLQGVVDRTREWVDSRVIEYNLCPYARTGSLSIQVCKYRDNDMVFAEYMRKITQNLTSCEDMRMWKHFYREIAPHVLQKAVSTVKYNVIRVQKLLDTTSRPHCLLAFPGILGFNESYEFFRDAFVSNDLLQTIEAWRLGHALDVEAKQHLDSREKIRELAAEAKKAKAVSIISFHPSLKEHHYDSTAFYRHCIKKGDPFFSHLVNYSPYPTLHLIPTHELMLARSKTAGGWRIKISNQERVLKDPHLQGVLLMSEK